MNKKEERVYMLNWIEQVMQEIDSLEVYIAAEETLERAKKAAQSTRRMLINLRNRY